jgi:hypothetical protein
MTSRCLPLALIAGLAVPWAGGRMAAAQPADHLKCYKVKADGKTKGLVDLFPVQPELLPERDCKVQGPVMFCAPAVKTNVRVEPPSPGAPAGPAETDHLCYKLKCPKPLPGPLTASDQFGTFALEFKNTALLCTPAVKATTTSTITTTTTSLPGPCGFDSGANRCVGSCPVAGETCVLTGPETCGCSVFVCQRCYVTVMNACNGTLCGMGEDCALPNELCRPDLCPGGPVYVQCPCCPVCGDGVCDAGDETSCNCAADCTGGTCLPRVTTCGDHVCDRFGTPAESHATCLQDCPYPCRSCPPPG